MLMRSRLIALGCWLVTVVTLPAAGWAWSSDLYRLDEALRLNYAADESLPFTAPTSTGPLDSIKYSDAQTSPAGALPEMAPSEFLVEDTDAETLDSPETLDFAVPIIRTPKIDKHVQFFSSRIRDRFEVWLNRLERHRPMAERIFAEFNLPVDLVFLSLVESGFSTNAVSRAKAVGPWQFIKPTAKAYGLRVDNWIDERRDPVKSTLAAAQYLRDLHQLFGSWPLAMAAYNAGERKVGRALVRAQADDFWDLTDTKLLKRETKEYVPRFLAAALIAKDPSRFGFIIPPPTLLEYEEVVLTHPLHLRTAARAAGVSYQELKALNPELRKDLTPPDPVYHLKVPMGSKTTLLNNLGTNEASMRVHAVRYQIRRGDTWALLASRHGTTITAILEANSLNKSDKPKPGEWLLLPQPKKAAVGTSRALAKLSR
jgi:membrane-bound lytic murein transglycosylase D